MQTSIILAHSPLESSLQTENKDVNKATQTNLLECFSLSQTTPPRIFRVQPDSKPLSVHTVSALRNLLIPTSHQRNAH